MISGLWNCRLAFTMLRAQCALHTATPFWLLVESHEESQQGRPLIIDLVHNWQYKHKRTLNVKTSYFVYFRRYEIIYKIKINAEHKFGLKTWNHGWSWRWKPSDCVHAQTHTHTYSWYICVNRNLSRICSKQR